MNISEIAKQLGSLGGKKTLERFGKEHFSEAGKKGMAVRWKNHIKKSKKKQ